MQWTRKVFWRYGLIALLAIALGAAGPVPKAPRLAPIRVDHHVHLDSPAIQAFVPEFCASVRRLHYGNCDPALTTPHSPAELLAAMDKAGIRRALVLSTAYLAESPMMQPQRPDAAALLRTANDWTVGLVHRYPGRFRAFISVDPLRPTALPEMARWKSNPAVTGLKLHLTASGVDLRRQRDLADLAAAFHAAAEAHWPIIIHLRTQRMDYGAPDVRNFLKYVLPAAGNTPVQIAHAAGWGGIDKATLSALGVFADAIAADPRRFRHVWFDLAGVPSDKAPDADKRAMVALIRKIGVHHFLPASDWPYNGVDLAYYYSHVYPELPLTAKEWAIIRSNVAPYAR